MNTISDRLYLRRQTLINFLTAVLLAMGICYADDDKFQSFDFSHAGIADGDLNHKLKLIAANEAGMDVLVNGDRVALVQCRQPRNDVPVFSFNFDQRPVTKYLMVTGELRKNMLREMRNPANSVPPPLRDQHEIHRQGERTAVLRSSVLRPDCGKVVIKGSDRRRGWIEFVWVC